MHPDEGSFLLWGLGQWLIIDDGYVNLKRTENHNLLLFNNLGQIGEGKLFFDTAAALKYKPTASIIFSDIETARFLLNYNNDQFSSIELKLSPDADQELIRTQVEELLNNDVFVKDRTQLNDALYKMLNTENIAVYLIFTLVIIIALFNVVGAIIMMILDKKSSINTLYNLGATTKDIRRVFFLQGSLMTILAGTIGLILGFIIVFLQDRFDLVMLTPSLAYPVEIKIINFILVILTILILGVLASKLASQRISKQLVQG